MTLAYVLINVEIGAMEQVVQALKKIPSVREAHMVYGVYDVIVKVEAETMRTLKEVVTWHIRKLDQVRSSQTLIVMNH